MTCMCVACSLPFPGCLGELTSPPPAPRPSANDRQAAHGEPDSSRDRWPRARLPGKTRLKQRAASDVKASAEEPRAPTDPCGPREVSSGQSCGREGGTVRQRDSVIGKVQELLLALQRSQRLLLQDGLHDLMGRAQGYLRTWPCHTPPCSGRGHKPRARERAGRAAGESWKGGWASAGERERLPSGTAGAARAACRD